MNHKTETELFLENWNKTET